MINYFKSFFNKSSQKLCKPQPPNLKLQVSHQNDITYWWPHQICVCYNSLDKKPMPLQNVHFYLKVQTGIVIVEVLQEYSTQGYEHPVEVEYLFVINKKAVVTKMTVEIGNEKKYGIVKEKEEAKKEYEQGIQQGKTMVYSDEDEEIPDIKKVKVGSLAPNKNLKITFEYVQPLEVFLNKYWKLEVSPLIDPFYFSETQFQKYPIYYQKVHEIMRKYIPVTEFELNYKQNISVEINNGSIITSFKSPTHKIISSAAKDFVKQGNPQNQVQSLIIMLEDTPENYLPNKQFVLLFSTDDINLPRAVLTHTNNDALTHQKYCATLTFIPKFSQVSLDDAYKQYLDGMNIAQDQKVSRGNYLFFLDRSFSMEGKRIEKAKDGLIIFLKSLPEDSFFNIISFGSDYKPFWNESKQYSQETLDEAATFVKSLKADMGGTEILKPLKEVVYNIDLINKYKQLQMTQNIFLLTDGEVNAQPVIDLISENQCAEIRIYTLGIGSGCSQYLIKRAAEVGNGKYHIMSDYEDLNAKVIDQLEDSLTSYLKTFTLTTNAANIYSIIPAPDSIVSLKKNQELMIQILFSTEQLKENVEFSLSCYDPQEQKPIKYDIVLSLQQSKQNDHFHKIAAHRFINYVEESVKQQDKAIIYVDYQKNQITVQDLLNISIQHQILSMRTAYVCEACNLEDQFKQLIRQKVVINKFNQNRKIQSSNEYRIGGLETENSSQKFTECKALSSQIISTDQICDIKRENIKGVVKDKQMALVKEKQLSYLSYQQLIQFAQADGSFQLSDAYQKQLKFIEFQIVRSLNQFLLDTLITLFYLELFCFESKRSWQLVYQKGLNYLQKNGITYQLEKDQYINKYKDLFKD